MEKMSKIEMLRILRDCVFESIEDSKDRLNQYSFEVNKSKCNEIWESYDYWNQCFAEEFEYKLKLMKIFKMLEKRIDKYYKV